MTDAKGELEVITAYVNGQASAEEVGQVLNQYRRLMYKIAWGILHNETDAEDAVQEAMCKAFKNLHQFEHRSCLSTWLGKITANTALMALRHQMAERCQSLDELLSLEAENHYTKAHEKLLVDNTTLEKLVTAQASSVAMEIPKKYRGVLILRYVEGYDTQETADILKISVQAVKSRALRGVRSARQKLQLRGYCK